MTMDDDDGQLAQMMQVASSGSSGYVFFHLLFTDYMCFRLDGDDEWRRAVGPDDATSSGHLACFLYSFIYY